MNVETKHIPLWLELGLFNIFSLVILVPILWFQFNDSQCWWSGCCCRNSFDYFHQINHLRVAVFFTGLLISLILELAGLRRLQSQEELLNFPWPEYTLKAVLRSLPILLLLLAVIAVPQAMAVYGLIGSLGLMICFGSRTGVRLLSPVSLIKGQSKSAILMYKWILLYLGLFVALNLFLLFLPRGSCDCSKRSSVKANMHTFQTLVETYAANTNGHYPPTTAILTKNAQKTGRVYWKDFTNPYTAQNGEGKSYRQMSASIKSMLPETDSKGEEIPLYQDILGIRVYPASATVDPENAGLVIYDYISPNRYYIYGMNIDGMFLIDKGTTFVLTNREDD